MSNTTQQLRFLSFWSINDKLDILKLKKQLAEIKNTGFIGVIFHPRYYPNVPVYLSTEYMNIVSELILYAKLIEMEFWIYDENGWPSGTASGEVLKLHPELQCQWLSVEKNKVEGIMPQNCIHSFHIKDSCMLSKDNIEGELYSIILNSKKAVSSIEPKACAYFIELTHERYKSGLSKAAFDYITGFFSDEVAFLDGHSVSVDEGAVPWNEKIKKQYYERYGEDLTPLLPLIFYKGSGYETLRFRFWELLTDAINEGFYLPIKKWCADNGKKFTAHLKGEENPFFQVSYSGSCFQVLKNISVPAVDALERHPGNNYYPRIAKSVSAQFYNGECLVEAMGGAGWGTTPEHFVKYMLWLASNGLKNIVVHLNQFQLNTQAIHDWPPSTPCHMTWKEAFPAIIEEIQQRAAKLPDLSLPAQLLIVAPTRGVMAQFEPHEAMQLNEHNGSNIPDTPSGRISEDFLKLVEECHKQGIHYEFTEERIIEEVGQIENGKLNIGNREYGKILIAEGCRWNELGNKILSELQQCGAKVLDSQTWRNVFLSKKDVKAELPYLNTITKVKQLPWKAEMSEANLLAIEFGEVPNFTLTSEIHVKDAQELSDVQLVIMDRVLEALLDGKQLEGVYDDSQHIFRIPVDYLIGKSQHLLEIRPEPNGEKYPVAFIKGLFLVKSLTPYTEKDQNQLRSKGPFQMVPLGPIDCNNMIETGLPFCSKPIRVSKIIEIENTIEHCSIQLQDIKADAAGVFVNGQELGWCWGPDWTIEHKGILNPGRHEITVELIPNTFNVFGPHHHIDGDRHLTSPAQYEGVKNFADSVDAPECTKIDEWSFVKFYIKGNLVILQE